MIIILDDMINTGNDLASAYRTFVASANMLFIWFKIDDWWWINNPNWCVRGHKNRHAMLNCFGKNRAINHNKKWNKTQFACPEFTLRSWIHQNHFAACKIWKNDSLKKDGLVWRHFHWLMSEFFDFVVQNYVIKSHPLIHRRGLITWSIIHCYHLSDCRHSINDNRRMWLLWHNDCAFDIIHDKKPTTFECCLLIHWEWWW